MKLVWSNLSFLFNDSSLHTYSRSSFRTCTLINLFKRTIHNFVWQLIPSACHRFGWSWRMLSITCLLLFVFIKCSWKISKQIFDIRQDQIDDWFINVEKSPFSVQTNFKNRLKIKVLTELDRRHSKSINPASQCG